MKAAGKLKNIDFKGFFVDHGEKVALGVIALIGLMSLLGTRWAGFSEIEPEQLKQKVDQTRSSVVASEWPEQERETYAVITNFEREATGLFDAIDIAGYRYSTDFTWPLFQAVENRLRRARLFARRVEVFHAHEPFAAGVARIEIARQCGDQ